MPIEDQHSRWQYAAFVQRCVEQILRIQLSDNFQNEFNRHAKFVDGFLDYEDFGAFVLLECQERKHLGISTTARDVSLILDRVRHRLVRQLRKQLPTPNTADPISLAAPSETAVAFELISRLNDSDMVILSLVLDGGVEHAAAETGKSLATIYRRLAAIRALIKSRS